MERFRNITVVNRGEIFPCNREWNVKDAEERIRSKHRLLGGAIEEEGNVAGVLGANVVIGSVEGRLIFAGAVRLEDVVSANLIVASVQYQFRGVFEFTAQLMPNENVRAGIIRLIEEAQFQYPRDWQGFRLQDLITGHDVVGAASILRVGQKLVFYNPQDLTPASSSKWRPQTVESLRLKQVMLSVSDFFQQVCGKVVLRETMSPKALQLTANLIPLSKELFLEYGDIQKAEQIRTGVDHPYPLLRDVLIKKLFLTEKYSSHESMVDSFVSTLLEYLGFFDGSLAVVPQLRLPLRFGDGTEVIEESSIADFIILDLVSFYRIAVMEDKSVNEVRQNSFPQLVAEAIALHQNNVVKETQQPKKIRKVAENESSNSTSSSTAGAAATAEDAGDPIFGIRVNGSKFFFYGIHISAEIQTAMKTLCPTHNPTNYYLCGKSEGYDFWLKPDREEIIFILDNLRDVISDLGSKNIRYKSTDA